MGGHLILFFIVCLSMYCKTSSEKFCNFFRWNYQIFFFFETLPINIVNIILYFRPVRSNLLYYQLILLIGNLKSSLCANKILYRSQYISIYIYFFFFFENTSPLSYHAIAWFVCGLTHNPCIFNFSNL